MRSDQSRSDALTSALGYYRFPTLYQDTIVFTAEGDLWQVGLTGGMAQRLTTHHGIESHAAISPDGSLIAFSAQYEGPTEIYTMPLLGGLPRRQTYEGDLAIVVGWTPDGKILYCTYHYSTLPNPRLAMIDPHRGEPELIPLNQASEGVFEPSGKTVFFTRLAFQGSHTKRYKGGTAQNIWKFTQGDAEAIPLNADYAGTSRHPMWWQGRVYFASDRDGTMNIWSMDETGENLRQHTHHQGWDVKSPSLHQGRIVYQLGADLHLLTLATDTLETDTLETDTLNTDTDVPLAITLASDFDQMREKWVKDPMDYLTAAHLSPGGDRLVLTARGRVFVAPTEQGRFVDVTRQTGIRYRNARFMPDGKSILSLSDQTGELEFYRLPVNGIGEPDPITNDGQVFRYQGHPSPDGKWIAYIDKNHQLWLHEIETQQSKRIAVSEETDNFADLSWSPDSRWLAYTVPAANFYGQIMLYSLKDETITPLTSDRVDSYNPVWSPDGKWLYFLSDRVFQSLVASPWGLRQPEPFFDKTTKIYLVALAKGERSPFQPLDELYQQERTAKKEATPPPSNQTESENAAADNTADQAAAPAKIRVELEGIQTRVMAVPIPAGNYRNLSINEKYLFWEEQNLAPESKQHLVTLEIKHESIKAKTFLEDIQAYELSWDGKKVLVRKGHSFYVLDAAQEAAKDLDKSRVDLSKWMFTIQPREEWRQMFIEAWRLERDYFYDRNLHGVDWQGLLAQHLPLVERVADREELNDLLAQLVGELAALHTFVVEGDRRQGADQIRLAALGASWRRNQAAGGYEIDYIYQADPDYPERLAPIAKPGLDIQVGDVIEAINGVPTLSVAHPALLLKNQAYQQVLLRVKSMGAEQSREVIVEPITSYAAANLRYGDWEYQRRLQVEALGQGKIGYVHLRAMGGDNYTEWVENFYPVFNREGLIIDVRHNGGGNIDSWILEKLLRKAWFYWQPRIGKPYWNMQYAFRGHMVVLCNEQTASDGEAFTEGFRRLGLGKVMGTRTWGGEIWLSFDTWLVDNGIASAAEIGVYGPEGEWLIEGHGVEPDITVDNLPHATFNGEDAQLEAAVKYLQAQIQRYPIEVPPTPPHPDKSFKYAYKPNQS
ncbi:MAG: protease [Cyanothece sp. SIO1E1]|nr:protease [Cyanothece sp. SIO1E1]